MPNSAPQQSLHVPLLRDRVYEVIKKKIVDLEYAPGQQLVEQVVCNELEVSKSPVREAFLRLEREGFLSALPYKGCTVSKITKEGFLEVFQVREALETYSLEKGFCSYTDEDIRQLDRLTSSSAAELRLNQRETAYMGHLDFHQSIVLRLGNPTITSLYASIADRLQRYLNVAVSCVSKRLERSNEEHFRIVTAIQRRDRDFALREMKAHLESVAREYLETDLIERYTLNCGL